MKLGKKRLVRIFILFGGLFCLDCSSETTESRDTSPESPIVLRGPSRHDGLGSDHAEWIYYRLISLAPLVPYRVAVERLSVRSAFQVFSQPDFEAPLESCDLEVECGGAVHCRAISSSEGDLYLRVRPAQPKERFALVASGSEPSPQEEPLLHVPSPCWEDQVIYFLMLDRFNDGNPNNNDMGAGEYDPNDGGKYSGGDIRGIIDKLDYIEELGATAIWITPPVANQWWTPSYGSGYHGYSARHFKRVDEHYGDLATYKDLSDSLHRRGLYLVQDIVANHMGNFFRYGNSYDPNDLTHNFQLILDGQPASRPQQRPFHLNNATIESVREIGIYHWTPSIGVGPLGNSATAQLTYQLADLDDLNTSNIRVREALKDSYSYWIQEVGADAFRVDTAKHSEHDFWHDFLYSQDGILAAARETGRENFFPFGEVFEYSPVMSDSGERILRSYLGSGRRLGFAAVLNFPLQASLVNVIARGQPTSRLAYRLRLLSDPSLFPRPLLSLNFLDNHDIDRFITGTDMQALKQGLLALLTLPGIPVVWMGTEQGFTDRRKAMFAGGYLGASGSFNKSSTMYRLLQSLNRLRLQQIALRRGDIEVLAENQNSSGELVYRRVYHNGDITNVIIVALNTSSRQWVHISFPAEFPEDAELKTLFVLKPQDQSNAQWNASGELQLQLSPRAGLILGLDYVLRQSQF